jgi:type IV pilus assembly protein PilB
MEVIDLTDQEDGHGRAVASTANLPARPDQIKPNRRSAGDVARRGGAGVDTLHGEDGSGTGGGLDPRGRMGERMVEQGILTAEQLKVALQEKKITGKMLGKVLVDLGFIDEATLTQFHRRSLWL